MFSRKKPKRVLMMRVKKLLSQVEFRKLEGRNEKERLLDKVA